MNDIKYFKALTEKNLLIIVLFMEYYQVWEKINAPAKNRSK